MFLYPSNINWLEEAAYAEVSYAMFISCLYLTISDNCIWSQLQFLR